MPKKLSKQATNASMSSSTTNSATAAPPLTASSGHPLLPPFLADGKPLPRAIVFDLDYTLWPFWVDTHVSPPLKPNASHSACTDKIGETFAFYRDVPAILHGLSLAGIRIGVASRTCAPDLGREMLKLLHIGPASSVLSTNGTNGNGHGTDEKKEKTRKAVDFFDAGLEIYPSSKIRHFESLHKRTGVPFTDMLFFDDESRNRDTEGLGVTMWLVRDGTTWSEVESGIAEWRRRRGVA